MGRAALYADFTEKELIDRSVRGDRAAQEELVRRLEPLVRSTCRRYLGGGPDVDDAAQEVFLRVFRNLYRWDGRRPVYSWVAAIAINLCRTLLLERGRRGPVLETNGDTAVSAAPVEVDEELADALRAALAELRPEYRRVLELFHLEGLPYETIAEMLDRPVGTIKTWLHRARATVARSLVAAGWDPTTVGSSLVPLETLSHRDD